MKFILLDMNKLMLKQVYDLFFFLEREKESSNFNHCTPKRPASNFSLQYHSEPNIEVMRIKGAVIVNLKKLQL